MPEPLVVHLLDGPAGYWSYAITSPSVETKNLEFGLPKREATERNAAG
jgi:hypothetical protein